jgi:hypothetical protein
VLWIRIGFNAYPNQDPAFSKHYISSPFFFFAAYFRPLGSNSGSSQLKSIGIHAHPDSNPQHWSLEKLFFYERV